MKIRWYKFALPDKRRPILILHRDEVIDSLNEIIVVPITRTIRGLATEVVLTVDDGMPVISALNFDQVDREDISYDFTFHGASGGSGFWAGIKSGLGMKSG